MGIPIAINNNIDAFSVLSALYRMKFVLYLGFLRILVTAPFNQTRARTIIRI